MAYPKTYQVIGRDVVNGTPPGGFFTLVEPVVWKHNPAVSWLNETALIQGGHIKIVKEAKETCELCLHVGTKAAAKAEYTRPELVKHFEKDHPGYQAPREG